MNKILFMPDEAAMLKLGDTLAHILLDHEITNFILHLEGDLGVGKTTLTRGILRGFGFSGKVKSPTYALVEHYQLSKVNIFHFDLYRLTNASDVSELGLVEYFDEGVAIVEWPEKLKMQLPPPDLVFEITIENQGRQIILKDRTPLGTTVLNLLE